MGLMAIIKLQVWWCSFRRLPRGISSLLSWFLEPVHIPWPVCPSVPKAISEWSGLLFLSLIQTILFHSFCYRILVLHWTHPHCTWKSLPLKISWLTTSIPTVALISSCHVTWHSGVLGTEMWTLWRPFFYPPHIVTSLF